MFTKIHLNKGRINLVAAAIIFAGAVLISYALVAQALSKDDIVYPVKELGNCADESECRSYCDSPENIKQCVAFAEKHNLISQNELEHAKKFIAVGAKGPGGCDSASSCESYCEDIDNIDECLAFAERTGLIPPDELEEARKVQAALKSGATLPGGCRNKNECEAYCENPNNMETCIAFGEAAGFIPPDELVEAKKVLAAIKQGATPPPCRGRNECDTYCRAPENMESCLTFAEAAGLIPESELQDAKKMLSAIKKGIKPPACGGREECDAYCSEDAHFEECLNFAEAAGFIAPEEVEMARKTGGKGPGNCKGREECEAFCQNPANQETCFSFAKEHGLLKEEDLRRMEESKQQILQGIDNAPPEVKTCLESVIDIDGIRSGTVMPREDIGQKMQSCFEQFMPKPERPGLNGEFPEGFQPPPGFEGGFPPGFEGSQPPEGFRPPEGFAPPEGFPTEGGSASGGEGNFQKQSEEQYRQQFEQQYQQQYEQQYQQEYQSQYEQQYQQQYQQQEQLIQQQFQQPQEFQQPPAEFTPPPPEPTSGIGSGSILGIVIAPFLKVLGF